MKASMVSFEKADFQVPLLVFEVSIFSLMTWDDSWDQLEPPNAESTTERVQPCWCNTRALGDKIWVYSGRLTLVGPWDPQTKIEPILICLPLWVRDAGYDLTRWVHFIHLHHFTCGKNVASASATFAVTQCGTERTLWNHPVRKKLQCYRRLWSSSRLAKLQFCRVDRKPFRVLHSLSGTASQWLYNASRSSCHQRRPRLHPGMCFLAGPNNTKPNITEKEPNWGTRDIWMAVVNIFPTMCWLLAICQEKLVPLLYISKICIYIYIYSISVYYQYYIYMCVCMRSGIAMPLLHLQNPHWDNGPSCDDEPSLAALPASHVLQWLRNASMRRKSLRLGGRFRLDKFHQS